MYNRNMNKKTVFSASVALVSTLCALTLSGCNKIKIAEYPPANTSFKYAKDDSVPFSSLGNAPVNPDRGLRGETYITLGSGEAFPDSGIDAYDYLDESLARFAPDDIKLMQVYVYLKRYCNEELPESALNELKRYLEYLSSKGVKALLRFAYESSSADKQGPRTGNVLSHLKTLKKCFEDNASLTDKSIYAFQLGFIGLWGEGHSSVHRLNTKKIVRAVFESFPSDMFVTVRTPELLSLVPEEYEPRAGIHDDYLIGYSHEWGMMDFSDPNYPLLLNKCKYSLNDAEMPWGDQSPDGMDLDGILTQAVGYGLSSLSIEHNYIENGNEYLLKRWQGIFLDESYFSVRGFPYNPSLFTDGKISVFDYLKHHLGYQLAISNLSCENGKATFLLTNYGFAAPFGYVLNVYSDGKKVYSEALDSLNIFSEKYITAECFGDTLEIELINNRSGERAYLYNDIEKENGLNVLRVK